MTSPRYTASRLVPLHLALALALTLSASADIIRNPSFESGADMPDHWRLSAPTGQWEQGGNTGDRSISVTRHGELETNAWFQDDIPVEPFATYRFTFHARAGAGSSGGCIVSGPDFANRDLNVSDQWTRQSHVFTTRPGQERMSVRLGQWMKTGTVYFDDVSVQPVAPVYRNTGGVVLGEGEKVAGGSYSFRAPLSGEGSNHSRPLASFSAGFNSNRWVFSPGTHVTYRHALPGVRFTSGTLRVTVNYYSAGDCIVEASADGEEYVQLARISGVETGEYALPPDLLPAEALWIRLRSPGREEAREDSNPGSFQINDYAFSAELDREMPDATGSTRYLDVPVTDPRLAVTVDELGALLPGGENRVRVRLANLTAEPLTCSVRVAVADGGTSQGIPGRETAEQVTVPANAEASAEVGYLVAGAGEGDLQLTVAAGDETLFAAATRFNVPSLYASDYGYPISSMPDCDLWWCEGTYKVSRERPAVVAKEGQLSPVSLSAARNEFEPCQIVLTPKRDIKGLRARALDLTGPGDARISAGNVEICSVWYHYVERPTDAAGCQGWWPDALPPLDEPIDLTAGQNQPLWVTVKVPADARAGLYSGAIELAAEGFQATVPVELRVWDFTLPEEPSITSAFGLSPGTIWQYQNITDEATRNHVWDLYMQNFRDHRIAPYAFWRSPIKVEYTGFDWTGGQVVAGDAFEGDKCLQIVDDSESASIAATAARRMNVDPDALYTLSFAARTTAPGQRYLVTLQSYNASGNWISGHNLDIEFTGAGTWKQEQITFRPADRSPDARSLQIVLRPAPWTEDGKHIGTAWFDAISLTREGTQENLVSGGGFEEGPGAVRPEVDFAAWDAEARKYLDEYHFTSFKLPLAGLGGGTFHERHYGKIGPYDQGTPEYRRIFRDYCMQVQNHLQENGWLDKAYVYWFDEPEPRDYEFVREGMQEIKLAGPLIQRMLTEEPNPALFGAVDIWCPGLDNMDPEICRERQEAGEKIWWYVCTGPKTPYPGLFIDHPAVDMRVWLWMSWKWNVQGVLVWTSNYWTSYCAYPDQPQNPWEDPMGYVSGYGLPAGHIGYWGNGDGRFLYPPNKDINEHREPFVAGPVNSIRWEMLREGMEDFEYFALLDKLTATRPGTEHARLLEVPESVAKSKTEFSLDPRPMHQHREAMARAIEALSQQAR